MVKIVALYGQPTDRDPFERHYFGTHVPLSTKVPAIRRVETARVVGNADDTPSSYYRVANVYFDSLEQMKTATASAEWADLVADAPNFVTGGVTVIVCEVDHG